MICWLLYLEKVLWFAISDKEYPIMNCWLLIGLLLMLCLLFIHWRYPVWRDRKLYGGTPWWMVLYCSLIVVFVFLIICGVGELIAAYDNSKIVMAKEARINNWWAILSQFADPGNLPAADDTRYGYAIALLSALAGIITLSGMFVSSIVNFISRKTEKWKQGGVTYDMCFNKYVVIIGVNEQTSAIAKQSLRQDDVKYVLIQTRQDVEKMRMRMALDLDKEDERKLVYYHAERISNEDIRKLHLEKAKEIYILGEDIVFDNEEDHDAFNIECLEHISTYMKEDKIKKRRKIYFGDDATRLKCYVNFEYQSTFTAFKITHIYQHLDKVVEFMPFNIHEIWAKKVLVDNFATIPSGKKGEIMVQRYKPLDGKGIKYKSDKSVRFIILGMNQMGTALGMEAALIAHYPNFTTKNGLRTTITFIDDNAIKEGEFLRGRFESLFSLCRYRNWNCLNVKKDKLEYKHSLDRMIDPLENGQYSYLKEKDGNFMDIQWEFVQGNIANDDIRNYINDVVSDTKHNITTIAICFNHPQQSIAAALYLPNTVFANALQVLTYQQNSFDLLNKVAKGEQEWQRYKNLYPFGMIDSCYSDGTLDISKAKIVGFLFEKKGDKEIKKKLVNFNSELCDVIDRTWNSLPLVKQLSNINMVDSIPGKIRSIVTDYHGNPDTITAEFDKDTDLIRSLAYSEHLRWITERLVMGFRPLKKIEYEKVEKKEKDKEYYKISHRAHLDICSNERLKDVDKSAPQNDKNNIVNIPLVLKCSEWLNFLAINKGDKNKYNLTRNFVINNKSLCLRYVSKETAANCEAECNHSFWIADSPVTEWQWYLITGRNKPNRKDRSMPKVNVSKDQVENFLMVLRKRTGLYFTLPSLKEWECAARLSTTYLTKDSHWKKYICYDKRRMWPVRSHASVQRNNLQVYDMLGNIWEWTRKSKENHPDCYYFCGGSYKFKRKECQLTSDKYWQNYWNSSLKSDDLGFRLIWKFDVDDKTANMLMAEISENDYGMVQQRDSQISGDDKQRINRRNKESTEEVKKLVSDWFKRYPMVSVNKGFFVMGIENQETIGKCSDSYPHNDSYWKSNEAGKNETPHHYVYIDKFKICSVPVTQELWNIVMNEKIYTNANPSANSGLDLPQTNVSYLDVTKFLRKLNKLTGQKYRLPSEAEWEYVAKGGAEHPIAKRLIKEYETNKSLKNADSLLRGMSYYKYSGSDNFDEVAWVKVNTNNTREVKKKKPVSDKLLVYDMSGNVWEWCEDYYQSDFYSDCINKKKGDGLSIQRKENINDDDYKDFGYISNPICLKKEYSAHVFRGGSYLYGKNDCRCTRPGYWDENHKDADLGFRLALSEE